MKFVDKRPSADPETAARRLMEHARAFEPVQDDRIYIEKINGPLLFEDRLRPNDLLIPRPLGLKLLIGAVRSGNLGNYSMERSRTC